MLVVFFGFVFSACAAFEEPSQPFPGGNFAAPLDTGVLDQTKSGNLTLDPGVLSFGSGVRGVIQLQPGQFFGAGAGFQFLPLVSNQTVLNNNVGAFLVNAQRLELSASDNGFVYLSTPSGPSAGNSRNAGLEIRANDPGAATYIDFVPGNTDTSGSGTPDYGGRIIYSDSSGFGFRVSGGSDAVNINTSGDLVANNKICLGSSCIDTWPSGSVITNPSSSSSGSSSQWVGAVPGNIYYNQGNVGIGTNNPNKVLHVVGSIKVAGISGQPDTNSVIFGSGNVDNIPDFVVTNPCSTGSYSSVSCGADSADGNRDLAADLSSCGTRNGTFRDVAKGRVMLPGSSNSVDAWFSRDIFCVDPDEPLYSIKSIGGTLTFTNKNDDKTLVVGQDGHVGVGTGAPQQPLAVAAPEAVIRLQNVGATWGSNSGGFIEFFDSASRGGWIGFGGGYDGNLYLTNELAGRGIVLNTGGRNRVIVDNVGNVKLNNGANLIFGDSAGANGFTLGVAAGSNNAFINQANNANLTFQTGGSGNIILSSGGSVGIGTASPNTAVKLDVAGGLKTDRFCLGDDCRSVWPSGDGTAQPQTPDQFFAKSNSYGSWSWTNVVAFLSPRINGSKKYDGSAMLSPSRPVLGIRISGSSDDGGFCIAGVKDYFMGAATNQAAFWSNEGAWSYGAFGLDGSYNAPWVNNKNANSLSTSIFIFDSIKSGIDWGEAFASGNYPDTSVSNKAAGVSYIPPNNTLNWYGFVQDGPSDEQLKCVVDVLYGDPVPAPAPFTLLVNGAHSVAQCENDGGIVTSDSSGNKFCQFSAAFCPITWTQYGNWSETSTNSCSGAIPECSFSGTSCTTGSHAWGDTARESCTYTNPQSVIASFGGRVACSGSQDATCSAAVTKAGCY